MRSRTAPRRRWRLALAAVLLVLVAAFGLAGSIGYVYDADLALLAAVAALGLNLLTGYAGQVSIGNAAFLAIGAYTVVFLHSDAPFPVPVLAGAVAAAAVGVIVGLPSLRLRGLYLIFSTLALQYLVSFLFEQYDSHTNALAGHFIPSPSLGPVSLVSSRSWYALLLVVVALTALVVWNMTRGRPGRAWAAVRGNEAMAGVTGINVVTAKLSAFVASSFLVGLAGGLGAYFLQNVSSDYYSLSLAVSYIAMILIGGLASIWGSIIGAVIVTVIPFVMSAVASSAFAGASAGGFLQQNLGSIDTAIYALAILLFLYFRPAGVANVVQAPGRSRPASPPPSAPAAAAVPARLPSIPAGAGSGAAPPVLAVHDLSVGYKGAGIGVSEVNFAVQPGQVIALLGPNGAGKTSTLRGIAGLLRRDVARQASGRVEFLGDDITALSPLERARRGVALVPESGKIFPGLTVAENLRLGGAAASRRAYRESLDRALEVFPMLKDHLRRKAGYLSGGQRQMLAIASALCASPRLLLVDEPTLGLSPVAVRTLTDRLRQLIDSGLPMIIAEQNIAVGLELSSQIHIFDGGRVIANGAPADILAQESLMSAYLGQR